MSINKPLPQNKERRKRKDVPDDPPALRSLRSRRQTAHGSLHAASVSWLTSRNPGFAASRPGCPGLVARSSSMRALGRAPAWARGHVWAGGFGGRENIAALNGKSDL